MVPPFPGPIVDDDKVERGVDPALGAAQALRQQGERYANSGQWNEALAAFDGALRLLRDDRATLLARSRILHRMGRFDEALTCVWQILGTGDNSPEVWLEAASALILLNRLSEARAVLRNALRRAPHAGNVWDRLGDLLAKQGKASAAEACFRRSARLAPGDPIVRLKLGQWMIQAARYEEAVDFFTETRRLAPWLPDAVSGLAQAFISQGRLDEAEPLLLTVLKDYGMHLDARLALARLHLLKANFAVGWAAYEWRRRYRDPSRRELPGPEWDGAPISGKTLLVYTEQGLGDAIQFLRFLPMLSARGAKVVLLVGKELKRLCRDLLSFPGKTCCRDRSLPAFDCHIPLQSVPLRLCLGRDDIVTERPYVQVAPPVKHKLPIPRGARLKVGLVWAGQSASVYDRHHRPIPLERLLPLAAFPDVVLYALQVGQRAEDLRTQAHPALIKDLSPRLGDLADTADIIRQLDLVITVDTSVAHLAGAMGKAVWVLLPFAPDWRWMPDGENTPWYPSMRLFRQRAPRQWADVIDRVAAELGGLAATRRWNEEDDQANDDRSASLARRVAALVRQGAEFQSSGETEKALDVYARAGGLDCRSADLFLQLSLALQTVGRLAAAEAACRRALALAPGQADGLFRLGRILHEGEKPEPAIRVLTAAFALAPTDGEVLVTLGHAQRDAGRPEEARRFYGRALRLQPGHRDARRGYADCLLREGAFESGFPLYASVRDRWDVNDPISPRWNGDSLDGRAILLRDDGDWADALQFARFIPDLVKDGAGRIIIQCHPQMGRLLATVPGVDRAVTSAQEAPACDCHAALSDLPSLLGIGRRSLPLFSGPYFHAAPIALPLSEDGGRKVGLVWAASSPAQTASCPLPSLLRLFEDPHLTPYSLQQGPERDALAMTGADAMMDDLSARWSDLAEAAAILKRLDLLITVDGPLAHLAGGLDVPAFLLLPFVPNWRWSGKSRSSPWYPSLRLFRQPRPGDWDSVLAEVGQALSSSPGHAG